MKNTDSIEHKIAALISRMSGDYALSQTSVRTDQAVQDRVFPASDETTQIISEIWQELQCKETLQAPQDVLDKIMEILGDHPEPSEDCLHLIVERLQKPVRQYHFAVALGGDVVIYEIPIQGENNLLLVKACDSVGVESQILTGNVKAPTAPRAMHEIARCIEEVLGVGHILGFYSFQTPLLMASGPIELHIEPWPAGLPLRAPLHIEFLIHSAVATLPMTSLIDLEKHQMEKGETGKAMQRLVEQMHHLFSSPQERSLQLRHAARLYVQAALSHDYGYAISLFFMALEALLLTDSKSDVQARLVEAVAYSIGHSSSGRDAIRKDIKKLYDLRSRFIHSGRSGARYEEFCIARNICHTVLQKEMDDLFVSTQKQQSETY